jgi:hypothetical protein
MEQAMLDRIVKRTCAVAKRGCTCVDVRRTHGAAAA